MKQETKNPSGQPPDDVHLADVVAWRAPLSASAPIVGQMPLAVVATLVKATSAATDELRARLIGRPQVTLTGRQIDGHLGAKPRALIYYLIRVAGPVSRAQLASLMWGDLADDAARGNLRLALSRIRQQLATVLRADNQAVWIDPLCLQSVDATDFEQAASRVSEQSTVQLSEALEHYRGPFLEGFEFKGAPQFDDWVRRERDLLQRSGVAIARALTQRLAEQSLFETAIGVAQRWLTIDETDEQAHRELMTLYARVGQRTLAINQYEALRGILAESLGARPSANTYELYRQIHADAPREQPLIIDAPMTPQPRFQNQDGYHSSTGSIQIGSELPRPATKLVGRRRELAEIADLFERPECRLICLTGGGGMGKTRIAIAAAEQVRCAVTFVPLAGLPAATGQEAVDSLVSQIAQCLRWRLQAPRPAAQVLISRLSEQNLLLVLDGFEHLLDASVFLLELLSKALRVRLLITSRERLAVTTEWVVPVAGLHAGEADYLLSMPGEQFPLQSDDMLVTGDPDWQESEAVQLFSAVAGRVAPGFDAGRNLPAILRIISFVHGSPLGIELAANWVRALPCDEIAARLTIDLDLLTAREGFTESRHNSMRAVLDSSWGLLDRHSQDSFAALGVFSGTFDAAAAQTVAHCGALVLTNLVDRSWVKSLDTRSGTRYLVHDLLRSYAQERLAEQVDRDEQIRELHARYFGAKLIAAGSALESFERRALRAIDQDLHNIRQAWRWFASRSSAAEVAEFVAAAHPYLIYKGWMSEAVAMVERALELPSITPQLTIRWHRLLAQDQWQSGRLGKSRASAEEILRLTGQALPRGRIHLQWKVSQTAASHLVGLTGVRAWQTKSMDAESAQHQAYAYARLSSIGYLSAESRSQLMHYGFCCHQISSRHDIAGGMMWSNAFLAIMWRALGAARLAEFYSARGYAALPRICNDSFGAMAAQALGIEQFITGNWNNAIELLKRSADCYATTGEWRLTMDTHAVTGLVEVARGRGDAARVCWQKLREGGHRQSDRLVQLWGLIGAVETDLRVGTRVDTDLLEQVQTLLESGTVHEQARFDAARAAVALARGHSDDAAQFACAARTSLQGRRFLPFYDGEGCVNVAGVFLSLLAANPDHTAWRRDADQATLLLLKFATSNNFIKPRALLLRGEFENLSARAPNARRLVEQASKIAHALGLERDVRRARQLSAQILA